MILKGKRLVLTGVITKDSIAFHAADRALREGASVILTSFGRARRMTERAAKRLPSTSEIDVLELDVNRPADLEALTSSLRDRWESVDGVLHAADRALREGASVILTSFGRARRMTERAAKRLPSTSEIDVLELDVNQPSDLEALTSSLRDRWESVDGVLHAIAFAPEDALGGRFMTTPAESASAAFQTSAFSLKALAAAVEPLMGPGGSIVGMDFDATVAWPIYDWMGVAKAALESVSRYLARDLGPQGIRVNLVSAGPLGTVAARGIPGFEHLADLWRVQAPLGWDVEDPAPVADAICFLLSDYARGISGEVVHVDGGFHAVGAPSQT